VEAIAPEALLVQTGYLTVREVMESFGEPVFHLGYPSREVRQAFNGTLLDHLSGDPSWRTRATGALRAAFVDGCYESIRKRVIALFAGIPYQWHANSPIGNYEAHYASVMYSHLEALGLPVTLEDSTSRGRADMTVRAGPRVYVMEFKTVSGERSTGEALRQIRERGYADRYLAHGAEVHRVGIEFSIRTRNVVGFEAELA